MLLRFPCASYVRDVRWSFDQSATPDFVWVNTSIVLPEGSYAYVVRDELWTVPPDHCSARVERMLPSQRYAVRYRYVNFHCVPDQFSMEKSVSLPAISRWYETHISNTHD